MGRICEAQIVGSPRKNGPDWRKRHCRLEVPFNRTFRLTLYGGRQFLSLRNMSAKPNLTHFPQSKPRLPFISKTNSFTCKSKTQILFSFTSLHGAKLRCYNSFDVRNLKISCQFCVSGNEEYDDADSGFEKAFAKWIGFVQSISPGGSWWNLSEHQEDDFEAAKPMTALLALRRMWVLISDARWIIFVAFGSLVIAAVSLL